MHTNAAVLIMDDDIMASAQDIQFAFRVWKVLACNSNTHCIVPYILLFLSLNSNFEIGLLDGIHANTSNHQRESLRTAPLN